MTSRQTEEFFKFNFQALPAKLIPLAHILILVLLVPVTHCIDIPVPPNDNFIEDRQPAMYTRINETRLYFCKVDSKFETDITQTVYPLFCNPDGKYDVPDWPKCVSSE